MEKITVTTDQLAAAFTEWDRLSREDPEAFQTETDRLGQTCESFGDTSAAYLMQILQEQAEA